MFSILRPADSKIRRVIQSQQSASFTYDEVGASRDSVCPRGFRENRFCWVIGVGEKAYQRAKKSLRRYQMLNLGWLQVVDSTAPVREGETLTTLVHLAGCYSLNVARVVYVDDDSSDRFQFGYGTLPCYPISGEERFTICIDRATDEVSFQIYSFARPASVLTKLGWPLVRCWQRRFCRDAMARLEG